MIKHHPAQIYKSDFSGLNSTEKHSCLSVFNFGQFQQESREPFGILYLFNQETLAPKHKVSIISEANTLNYILPLYGGFDYSDCNANDYFTRVEQIQKIIANKKIVSELSNPYDKNISYLHFGLKAKNENPEIEVNEFDFTLKNSLISLFENNDTHGFIGIYDGRKEAVYHLKNQANGLFVFVINGAFEFENRLLEAGDALSLSEIEFTEWEALSENAILLLLEIPLHEI